VGSSKRAFKDAASRYRNEAVRAPDANGPVGEPLRVALGKPNKPGQPLLPAVTIYDGPPMDFVLVAPGPEVPAVLELAS
jgi:hypothetical protein